MDKFWYLIEALQKGKELKNKANWKNSAIRIGFFLALLHAILGFLPIQVSQAEISQIVNGLDAMFGLYVSYVTAATSTTVGITKK